jgi:hypothetical protein
MESLWYWVGETLTGVHFHDAFVTYRECAGNAPGMRRECAGNARPCAFGPPNEVF